MVIRRSDEHGNVQVPVIDPGHFDRDLGNNNTNIYFGSNCAIKEADMKGEVEVNLFKLASEVGVKSGS